MLDDTLAELAKQIEPTAAQKAGAKRSHSAVRASLDDGKIGARILDSELSGSYARHTAIRPLDDVDALFFIDPQEWKTGWFETLPPPERVLTTFHRAIKYRYPSSSVRMQRRSVGLQLYHLSIDAVPAVFAERDDFIFVPDIDAGTWIPSAPRVHARTAAEVNKRTSGVFKPLVKLLKHWNGNLPEAARLKGFAVETIALRLLGSIRCRTLTDGAIKFFDFLASFEGESRWKWENDFGVSLGKWNWSWRIPDVADTGSNLAHNMTGDRRERFLRAAAQAREGLILAAEVGSAREQFRLVCEALRR
jgi:SMODS domain-containing protein